MAVDHSFTSPPQAVLTVGTGRGFVVENHHARLVITAAHCLPSLPPAVSFSSWWERTYDALLAPLGAEPAIAAECRFADPVADIAVLGPPDGQEAYTEYLAYEALMSAATTLPISDPPEHGPCWLLSLDGRWFRCDVRHRLGPLWLLNSVEGIEGGMSGSPILADDGSAIGVLCTSGGTGEVHTEGGPNPRLIGNLPGWLLCELGVLARRESRGAPSLLAGSLTS